MGARGVHVGEVHRHDEDFFPFGTGLGDDFAAGAGHKALPPKFNAVAAHAVEDFVADAVGHGYIAAVGDGMGALDGFPGAVLLGAVSGLFAGMPADGRGIEKNLRALHGRQPRGFGIPLVPADQHANLGISGRPCFEAEVAGREIKFLVVKRVVGNVHLAIDAEE